MDREICRVVCKELGLVIRHPEIWLQQPELFRRDRVHSLDVGLEIFLQDLKRALHLELDNFMMDRRHS